MAISFEDSHRLYKVYVYRPKDIRILHFVRSQILDKTRKESFYSRNPVKKIKKLIVSKQMKLTITKLEYFEL